MNTASTFLISGRERSASDLLPLAVLVTAAVAVSFAIVHSPWMVTGAVVGMLVLAMALFAPLALVGLMLVVGQTDLSFMTGGFKSLFPEMGGLDMNGIRLLGVSAGFLVYILFEPRSRAAALGRQGRIWLAFLAYAGMTLLVSIDPLGGLRFWLKLAYPLLTFLIVVGVADSRERVQLLMTYTIASAAFIAVILNPILALAGGYRVDAATGTLRIGGLGLGDNPFSFYALAMMLIVFTRFVLRGQVRYLFLAGLLVVWIALTQTRIAAAGAVVGLLAIGVLGALTSGNRKILIVGVGATIAVAAIMLPRVLIRSLGFVPSMSELLGIMANPLVLYQSIHWEGRELLWAIAWGALMSAPLFGLGLGSCSAIIRETFPNQSVQIVHNEYLRVGTDTGILGVVLFAAAIVAWLIAVYRLAIRGDRLTREFAFPAVATILAWAVISITDNPIDYYTQFTQYIGFLVGAAIIAHETAPKQAEASA